MNKKRNSNWNSTESLLKAINVAVVAERFDGSNSAIAQVNRLRKSDFSGDLRPQVRVIEERIKVYEAAYRFYLSKRLFGRVKALHYKSLVEKLQNEVNEIRNDDRIVGIIPSLKHHNENVFKEL